MAINYGQGTPERPSQGWKLFITATVMVMLAGFFVASRLAVRLKSKLVGPDDYTIAFSLVSFYQDFIGFSNMLNLRI